jgi:RNA polymerase sigma-70 factor, ECF subfamily
MPMTGSDLSTLLLALLPRLWKFALRITDDQHYAENLVQLACVHALEQAHHLQPDTVPLRCLSAMVQATRISEVCAHVRDSSRLNQDDHLIEVRPDTAACIAEQDLMHSQVVHAVRGLPEPQRSAMLLIAVEGLSYSEAAQTLDVPIGTIMIRISQARQAIGAFFVERHDGDGPK